MDEGVNGEGDDAALWPSIDDSKPSEEGGPIARSGFNYQDEIAVGFLIEMLESSALLEVHCETHDDVVLVRTTDEPDTLCAEYVQVKASEPDKLWSVADICRKKKGKDGTSIYEISLARDTRAHDWWGRLLSGDAASAEDIAREENITRRYVNQILPLAFLSPEITRSLLDGAQPVDLTAKTLSKGPVIPVLWPAQLQTLGFDTH